MKRSILLVITLATVLSGPAFLHAQATQTAPPPDNTKVNKQGGTTADKQSQSKSDIAITQQIRQAVMKDKTLSMDAHNCKIITQSGAVTLRGPVKSAQEKDTIEKLALKIAGDGKVTNDLTVKVAK